MCSFNPGAGPSRSRTPEDIPSKYITLTMQFGDSRHLSALRCFPEKAGVAKSDALIIRIGLRGGGNEYHHIVSQGLDYKGMLVNIPRLAEGRCGSWQLPHLVELRCC